MSFQSNAFQRNAFQISAAANDNNSGGYTYVKPYDEYLQRQEKLRKEKTELQKVESVIAENKRLAELAAKNKLEASKKAAERLARLEAEYLGEINRLTQVRVMLMQRIKQNEEAMIMLLAMKRRRFA